jgi:hypothetical protein
MSDPHWGFIVAAYVVTAFVIGGVTLKIALDYRALKLALSKMAGANATRDDVP